MNLGSGGWRGPDGQTRRQHRRGPGGGAFDLLAVAAMMMLAGLGVLNLYAVAGREVAIHQLVTALAGLALLALLWRSRIRMLAVLGWVCYGIAVLFLLAVLVVGLRAYGATRWLGIGSFTFQPSEFAKLGMLLVLASVLGSDRPPWRKFMLAVLLALAPIMLTVLEPDLSTASLLVMLASAMLILGRIPVNFLLPLFGGAAVAAPLAIHLLRPYQLARLRGFVAGAQTLPGPGWAIQQAHIAVAMGGLFGRARDPLHGLFAEYLPDGDTDLALASLVEEWGLLAGVLAVVAALVLVWRVALASRVPRTPRAALVAGGLAVLLGTETVVSLGGNLGLLPLAGVPFPLLSYGGTAVVVHLAALGVVLSVRRDGARRKLWVASRWRHARPRLVRFAALGVSVVLVVFGLYAWQLQMEQGLMLSLAGQVEMTRCISLPAPRGIITDRHGTPLVANAETDKVLVVPALLRADTTAVNRLAALTGGPVGALTTQLAGAARTQLSMRVADVPAPVASQILAAKLPGVVVVPDSKRRYPDGPMLAPILGFAGIATAADTRRWSGLPPGEIVGRAGIEQQYDAVLRGLDGQQCVFVDPAGVPVSQGPRKEPVPGANLRLSLDLGLQRRLTDALAGASSQERSGGVGAAVAMDPRSGQVFAMASVPSYDNNVYGPPVDSVALRQVMRAPGNPTLEHVDQVVVPPGSTFKLVVAAADLRHPVFPPEQVIPTGGSFDFGGHTFHNWSVLSPMNLVQSIAWSNDVYFYKLASALGADAMISTARDFGVGVPTGIDLPGEASGYLGSPGTVRQIGATWYPGATVILGIGQGYLDVTPLQDARWTAAVATGSLVTPRLALAAGRSGGVFTALPWPVAKPVPFAGSLGLVRDGMRAAVTSGTAGMLGDVPALVGAKTGTAQDATSPSGVDDWMTAVAPMDNPAVVMTAMVQAPGEGATRAGPLVEQAMRYYFAHQAEILATAGAQ